MPGSPPGPPPAGLARAARAVEALGALMVAGGAIAAAVEAQPLHGPRAIVVGLGLLAAAWTVLSPVRWAAGLAARGPLRRLPDGAPFVLGVWLGYTVLTRGLAVLALLWLPRADGKAWVPAQLVFEPLCHEWDAAWYRSVAFEGYYFGRGESNAAFFPLFPLLLRATSAVLPSPCAAAWLVSQAGLIAGLAGVLAVSRLRLADEVQARLAVLLTLAYPFAFFHAAAYPEPLLLGFAAWALWAGERGRFWLAGVLGALASATRIEGLALLPALALLPERDGAAPGLWRAVRGRAGLLLVPAGALLFFAFLWWRFGDPLAYFRAASLGWDRGLRKGGRELFLAAAGPFTLAEAPRRLLFTGYLLMATALAPLLAALRRAHGWAPVLFVLCVALPGVLSGLEGFGRHLAVAFPLAWVLTPTLVTRPLALGVTLASGLGVQALLLTLHALGYWMT